MSHEISTIETADGRTITEAMYANRPAWHGLGQIFSTDGQDAPDSETALELAHLDWTVEKQPLYLGDGSPAPDCFATVRQDTGAVLGSVGARYSVFQNRDAFAFLDSLQQDGVIRYESAFALRGGRQVALLARMPSVDQFAAGDIGLRYILLRTSHDASCEIDLCPTSVRVVCANTVRAALSRDAKHRTTVRHSGNLDAKLRQVRTYLSIFDRQFTEYRDAARRLAETPIDPAKARDFIDLLFPIRRDDTDRTKNAREKRVAAVRHAWNHRSNQIAGQTWWRMLNSLSYAVDHAPEFNRRKGDTRTRAESKFLALVDGDSARLKSQALQLATQMAGLTA